VTANPPPYRKLTAAEFMRLALNGAYANLRGERVELIGGEVVTVSPQGGFHSAFIDFTADALKAAFGPDFWVRVQYTLDLAPHSVVDPDIAVVAGSRADNFARLGNGNPTTALLVVESSLTTIASDRTRKASLYAAAGIADYWIIDVQARRLEVRRDPRPDPAAEFGASYQSLAVLAPGEVVTPLARPAAVVAVADMIPA